MLMLLLQVMIDRILPRYVSLNVSLGFRTFSRRRKPFASSVLHLSLIVAYGGPGEAASRGRFSSAFPCAELYMESSQRND